MSDWVGGWMRLRESETRKQEETKWLKLNPMWTDLFLWFWRNSSMNINMVHTYYSWWIDLSWSTKEYWIVIQLLKRSVHAGIPQRSKLEPRT